MPRMLSTPPVATHSADPSEQSDGLPANTDASDTDSPHHFTRSHTPASSPAMSVSIALNPLLAPLPTSREELNSKVNRLRMTCELLEKKLRALEASEAHRATIKHAESDARAELPNKKENKGRRTVKTTARYATHDTTREMHAPQTRKKAKRAREAAEEQTQKAEEEAACEPQIWEDIQLKVFSGPLSSYRRKDDLVVLAEALGLKTKGTVNKLATNIKSHLSANPHLQLDPQFAGLFLQNKRRRVDTNDSVTERTTSFPGNKRR